MKKLVIILFLIASTSLAAVYSFAQEAAPETVTDTASSLPPPPQAEPEAKSQPVNPPDLMVKALAVLDGLNSYTVEFSLAQAGARGKIKDDQIDKYTERYVLSYLDDNPEDDVHMLRLEGIEGYNRRTTVVFAPDESGEHVYTVYKPALPKGNVLKKDNILMRDIEKTPPTVMLKQINDLVLDENSEITANYYPAVNKYIVEIIAEMPYRNKTAKHKVTVKFAGADYRMLSREIRVMPKNKYLFSSRMEWFGFDPDTVITEEDITKAPNFNKE